MTGRCLGLVTYSGYLTACSAGVQKSQHKFNSSGGGHPSVTVTPFTLSTQYFNCWHSGHAALNKWALSVYFVKRGQGKHDF